MTPDSSTAGIYSGAGQSLLVLLGFDAIRLLCTILFTISRWIFGDTMPTVPSPDDGRLFRVRWSLPRYALTVMSGWATTYGELFKLRIGFYDYVVVNSPEAFHAIFWAQSGETSSKVPAPIRHGFVNGGFNLFAMEYAQDWRTNVYNRNLHAGLQSDIDHMRPVRAAVSETKRLVRLLAMINPGDEYFDAVARTTFSVMMTMAYGRRIHDYSQLEFGALLRDTIISGKLEVPFIGDEIPPLASRAKSLLATLASCIGFFSRVNANGSGEEAYRHKMTHWNRLRDDVEKNRIIQNRAKKRRVDVVKEDGRPNFGYFLAETRTSPVIIAQDAAAWLAGGIIDCGAGVTAEALHCLIQVMVSHPGMQRKAQEEVDEVCDPRGVHSIPHFGDVVEMPFVKACVKELLRLVPIIPWGVKHFTTADVTYRDHRIPRGTVLLANTPFLNRDPARYPDPHRFNPFRFPEDAVNSSQEYAILPAGRAAERDHFSFGGGLRMCPGIYMAETILELALAKLLRAFDLNEAPGHEEPIYSGSFPFGTNKWLRHSPVRVHFQRRRHFRTGVEIGDFTADEDDEEIYLEAA